jgi:hypothetical protein
MATVVVNEAAIARLLNSTMGPVGREIARKADAVASAAYINASGSVIGVETGNLRDGIRAHVEGTATGVVAVVGTDAKKISNAYPQGFPYPAFHDVSYPPGSGGGQGLPFGGAHPWLTSALREVFP